MLLNDHQINLLQACYSSIWIGSCSADFIPDMIRLTGARLAEDKVHLDLFVPQQYTRPFFKNIQENKNISFLCSSIHTFEAYQIKGSYTDKWISSAEEQEYQQSYINGFAKNILDIGVKAGRFFKQYYQEPAITIRMKVEEVYEQTPKTGTGKRTG